ncbi:MAG: 16S rRNA (cytosine(967)-C(5))-methyltransferase RsmB [Limnochordales bacterium]|nr:16S rRNA (cytosine(967)-C(5))-methyltransferase RsmB [Limnochordales bacterium]
MGARDVALRVLLTVEEADAFATLSLHEELKRARLNVREAALASQLVYGTLRWRGRLDWQLELFLKRPLEKLDPPVRNALRLGLYQALFLHSIPVPVAVHESVELVRRSGCRGAAGFVNAVLRKAVQAKVRQLLPPLAKHPAEHLAIRYSHPLWLVERWINRLGCRETARLCLANNRWPPLTLRTNLLRISRIELIAALAREGVRAVPGRYAPEAVLVEHLPGIESSAAFRAGFFQVQDESSMLVAHLMAPGPDDLVLDLCSAPGGKTTHLAEYMGGSGRVIAFDPKPAKLRLVASAARRLGLSNIETRVADARQVSGYEADRVLVDAPCSGLGVLRRRPELRWRRSRDDIRQLVQLQREILAAAARLVRPGGVLVYSTCTTEPEENEENVGWFLNTHSNFRLDVARAFLPVPADALQQAVIRLPGSGGECLQLWPHRHGTDGFFMARLTRLE